MAHLKGLYYSSSCEAIQKHRHDHTKCMHFGLCFMQTTDLGQTRTYIRIYILHRRTASFAISDYQSCGSKTD